MVNLERPRNSQAENANLDDKIRELDELKFDSGEFLLERWLRLAETALKKRPKKQQRPPQ